MNDIKSFTFFEDYYNLISTLPKKEYMEISVAILDYMFKNEKPNLEGHLLAIFNTLSYQLNASKKQSKARQKKEPKENQEETRKEPKENQKGNQTKTNNNISTFYFLISTFNFKNNNNLLKKKLEEWIKYKWEKKEYYKETGFNTLLARIDSATSQYGVDTVINLIDECMASNYKGIIFEKLKKQQGKILPTTEWLGKEFESQEATDEEIAELEKRMKR